MLLPCNRVLVRTPSHNRGVFFHPRKVPAVVLFFIIIIIFFIEFFFIRYSKERRRDRCLHGFHFPSGRRASWIWRLHSSAGAGLPQQVPPCN